MVASGCSDEARAKALGRGQVEDQRAGFGDEGTDTAASPRAPQEVHADLRGDWPPLDELERRFERAADAASLGVWDWDLVNNSFVYSRRAKEICGFPPDATVTFEQVHSVTHPEDLVWTLPLARRALSISSTEPKPTLSKRVVSNYHY
jgi:PAS domain-containing protein